MTLLVAMVYQSFDTITWDLKGERDLLDAERDLFGIKQIDSMSEECQ
jgi:hypothetical protein